MRAADLLLMDRYAGLPGQATYWLGAAAMAAAFPVTAYVLWSRFKETPFQDGAGETAKIIGEMARGESGPRWSTRWTAPRSKL